MLTIYVGSFNPLLIGTRMNIESNNNFVQKRELYHEKIL